MKKARVIISLLVLIALATSVAGITNTVFGDIDGDGDEDFYLEAMVENNINALYWLNATDGIGTIPGVTQGYFVDVTGDGREDLFISRAGLTDYLYRNDGGKKFTNITGTSIGQLMTGLPGDTKGVVFADFDNDGVSDAYVNGRLLLSNGSTFASVNSTNTTNASGLSNYSFINMVPKDINKDGWMDIIGVTTSNKVVLLLNLRDINNDGIIEFYDATIDASLELLQNVNVLGVEDVDIGLATNGTLNFFPFTGLQNPFVEDEFDDIYIGSSNKNSLLVQLFPTVVKPYPLSGGQQWYIPEFINKTNNVLANADNASQIVMADFDNNNFADIVIGNNNGDTVLIRRINDTWGVHYTSAQNISSIGIAKVVQAHDWNKDGVMDLVYIDASGAIAGTSTPSTVTYNGAQPDVEQPFIQPFYDIGSYDFFGSNYYLSNFETGVYNGLSEILASKGVIELSNGAWNGNDIDIEDPPERPRTTGGGGGGYRPRMSEYGLMIYGCPKTASGVAPKLMEKYWPGFPLATENDPRRIFIESNLFTTEKPQGGQYEEYYTYKYGEGKFAYTSHIDFGCGQGMSKFTCAMIVFEREDCFYEKIIEEPKEPKEPKEERPEKEEPIHEIPVLGGKSIRVRECVIEEPKCEYTTGVMTPNGIMAEDHRGLVDKRINGKKIITNADLVQTKTTRYTNVWNVNKLGLDYGEEVKFCKGKRTSFTISDVFGLPIPDKYVDFLVDPTKAETRMMPATPVHTNIENGKVKYNNEFLNGCAQLIKNGKVKSQVSINKGEAANTYIGQYFDISKDNVIFTNSECDKCKGVLVEKPTIEVTGCEIACEDCEKGYAQEGYFYTEKGVYEINPYITGKTSACISSKWYDPLRLPDYITTFLFGEREEAKIVMNNLKIQPSTKKEINGEIRDGLIITDVMSTEGYCIQARDGQCQADSEGTIYKCDGEDVTKTSNFKIYLGRCPDKICEGNGGEEESEIGYEGLSQNSCEFENNCLSELSELKNEYFLVDETQDLYNKIEAYLNGERKHFPEIVEQLKNPKMSLFHDIIKKCVALAPIIKIDTSEEIKKEELEGEVARPITPIDAEPTNCRSRLRGLTVTSQEESDLADKIENFLNGLTWLRDEIRNELDNPNVTGLHQLIRDCVPPLNIITPPEEQEEDEEVTDEDEEDTEINIAIRTRQVERPVQPDSENRTICGMRIRAMDQYVQPEKVEEVLNKLKAYLDGLASGTPGLMADLANLAKDLLSHLDDQDIPEGLKEAIRRCVKLETINVPIDEAEDMGFDDEEEPDTQVPIPEPEEEPYCGNGRIEDGEECEPPQFDLLPFIKPGEQNVCGGKKNHYCDNECKCQPQKCPTAEQMQNIEQIENDRNVAIQRLNDAWDEVQRINFEIAELMDDISEKEIAINQARNEASFKRVLIHNLLVDTNCTGKTGGHLRICLDDAGSLEEYEQLIEEIEKAEEKVEQQNLERLDLIYQLLQKQLEKEQAMEAYDQARETNKDDIFEFNGLFICGICQKCNDEKVEAGMAIPCDPCGEGEPECNTAPCTLNQFDSGNLPSCAMTQTPNGDIICRPISWTAECTLKAKYPGFVSTNLDPPIYNSIGFIDKGNQGERSSPLAASEHEAGRCVLLNIITKKVRDPEDPDKIINYPVKSMTRERGGVSSKLVWNNANNPLKCGATEEQPTSEGPLLVSKMYSHGFISAKLAMEDCISQQMCMPQTGTTGEGSGGSGTKPPGVGPPVMPPVGPGLPMCGNNIIEAGEQCEPGLPNAAQICTNFLGVPATCNAQCGCQAIGGLCGNGAMDPGEQCDPGMAGANQACVLLTGNAQSTCNAQCACTTPGMCGNGVLEVGEQCDDGNLINGDGCDANCTIEANISVCGNGVLEVGEQCDDGNLINGDGCSSNCTTELNLTNMCVNGLLVGETETGPHPAGLVGVCSGQRECVLVNGIPTLTAWTELIGPNSEICTDFLDNDCDGMTDCNDVDCIHHNACIGPTTPRGQGFETSRCVGEECSFVTPLHYSKSTEEEKRLLDRIDLPSGYEYITIPFKLTCCADTVDATIVTPEGYTDMKLMSINGGVNEIQTITTTEGITCRDRGWSDLIYEEFDRKRQPEYKPVDYQVPEGTSLTTEELSIQFSNKIGEFTVYDSSKKMPASIDVRQLTPQYTLSFEKPVNGKATVAVDYAKLTNILPDSIKILAYKNGKWKPLETTIKNGKAQTTIELRNYVENSEVIFAVFGNECEACQSSTLEMRHTGMNGDALILVHGILSSKKTYEPLVKELQYTNYPLQVWTFDYPSNGNFEQISKELAEQIESRSNMFERVSIVGHSLGGLIAQRALQIADANDYAFKEKVYRIISAGAPNKGSAGLRDQNAVTEFLLNSETGQNILGASQNMIDAALNGKQIPQVKGVDYMVIAGTQPYDFTLWDFKIGTEGITRVEPNDGIVTVDSAQTIGDGLVNDMCTNYYEADWTHGDLIDEPIARKIIARIASEEQELQYPTAGFSKYLHAVQAECTNNYFAVIGKPIPKKEVLQPLACACGNGVCGQGENAENCPTDCAVIMWPIDYCQFVDVFIYVFIAIAAFMLIYSGTGFEAVMFSTSTTASGLLILLSYLGCGTVPLFGTGLLALVVGARTFLALSLKLPKAVLFDVLLAKSYGRIAQGKSIKGTYGRLLKLYSNLPADEKEAAYKELEKLAKTTSKTRSTNEAEKLTKSIMENVEESQRKIVQKKLSSIKNVSEKINKNVENLR